jgi:hypothetical protein
MEIYKIIAYAKPIPSAGASYVSPYSLSGKENNILEYHRVCPLGFWVELYDEYHL